MTGDPLQMVLKILGSCREGERLVETVRLPIDPPKASEFTKLLDDLITATREVAGLVEVRVHPPARGSNDYLLYEVWDGPAGLRRWWEGTELAQFQSALRERQLLAGAPDLHFNRF